MTALNRREFLQRMAAAGVAVGAAGAWPSIGNAAAWGCSGACVAPTLRVLEIFCYGGMSQWENFWVSRDAGSQSPLNWRGFHDEVQALDWSECSNAPSSALQTQYFADAANGTAVNWGPATRPLWPLMEHIRPVVVRPGDSEGVHALDIHKGLTGRNLGDPRAAGLGTAIAHLAQSIAPQTLPYSYVLSPKEPGSFGYVSNYAASAGEHPGWATPLSLTLDKNGFGDLLNRQGMTSSRDALLMELRNQYQYLLQFHGTATAVRASGFDSFSAASHYTQSASALLHQRIGGDALALDTDSTCVVHPDFSAASADNATRRSIELAAYLLQNAGAQYVGVIDGGLARTPEGDSPYDTHCNYGTYSHVQVTSGNLWNVLDSLAGILTPPAPAGGNPGGPFGGVDQYKADSLPDQAIFEGPPGVFSPGAKVSLANTLVIINTEFGRTPSKVNFGRNHSERSGHVALLMGGPVNGGSIAGHIDTKFGASKEGKGSEINLQSAEPVDFATPADVHAAVLDAVGVDIWRSENFRQSDDFGPVSKPQPNTPEDDILAGLRNHVLGVS